MDAFILLGIIVLFGTLIIGVDHLREVIGDRFDQLETKLGLRDKEDNKDDNAR